MGFLLQCGPLLFRPLASSCPLILCFLLSVHPELPIVRSSWASYCPFILSFLLFFRHLFPLVLSSSALSCPFSSALQAQSFQLLVYLLLLLILFSSASRRTFILCFSLYFFLWFAFSLSFHPLLPFLLTRYSTMIKFIISSAPLPPPSFSDLLPRCHLALLQEAKCLNINREILPKHIEKESQKIV